MLNRGDAKITGVLSLDVHSRVKLHKIVSFNHFDYKMENSSNKGCLFLYALIADIVILVAYWKEISAWSYSWLVYIGMVVELLFLLSYAGNSDDDGTNNKMNKK